MITWSKLHISSQSSTNNFVQQQERAIKIGKVIVGSAYTEPQG
jgi:hypothetical protein